MEEKDHVRYSGTYLEFRETDKAWEYVIRPNAKGCVAILAITDDNKIILNEQFRPPVRRNVIELPAGLAGDIPLQEDEPLETAARREFKEETGYEAKRWTKLAEGPSSAGLTNEYITIFQASGLTRVGEGGGHAGENITVHFVDLTDLHSWAADQRADGKFVDFKIFAALQYSKAAGVDSRGRLWY